MVRLLLCIVFVLLAGEIFAQVKPEHLFNASMPYGVLDIRTKISATHYYYLQEDKTFSFRESAPGVKTNSFRDMTAWDSSPYRQGNLRRMKDGKDEFVMNYRLLMPGNYDEHYTQGYPLLLLFHGAKERGNCYYEDCHHADFTYDPNVNNPPAPTTVDHPLMNNDHHLIIGAQSHLQARDAAAGKYPSDPSLSSKAFPGFVLIPQMMNVWDSLNVQDVIRIVQLITAQYQVDKNSIYVEGLSIGGYAVYEALKRAPWLFASAVAMSAVSEAANIFKHQQQNKVRHIPLWAFQGGIDKDPSPAFTESILKKFKDAGALPRYTLYPPNGHVVWTKAFAEPDFYRWLLSKKKNNLHIAFGVTEIDKSKNKFPVLEFAEGFYAYQWQKDGTVLAGENSNRLTAKEPGNYRGRFSRVSSPATESAWSVWSAAVAITQATTNPGDTTDTTDGDDGQGEDDDTDGDSGEGDSGGDNDGGNDDGGSGDEDTDGDSDGGTDDNGDGEDNTDDGDGDSGGEDDSGGDSGGEDDSGGDSGGEDDSGGDSGGDTGEDDSGGDSGGDAGEDDSDGEDGSGNNGGGSGEPNPDSTEVITGIPPTLHEQVELYPNPVTGESFMVKLAASSKGQATIIIIDSLGRPHRAETKESEGSLMITPSPRLPSGLYILLVQVGGVSHHKRLVVR